MSDSDRDPSVSARNDLDDWRVAACSNAFDTDPFLRPAAGTSAGRAVSGGRRTPARGGGERGTGSGCTCSRVQPRREPAVGQAPRRRRAARWRRWCSTPPTTRSGEVFWAQRRAGGARRARATRSLSGAIAYLLDQHGEAGHACPVACTAGAIKLLQRRRHRGAAASATCRGCSSPTIDRRAARRPVRHRGPGRLRRGRQRLRRDPDPGRAGLVPDHRREVVLLGGRRRSVRGQRPARKERPKAPAASACSWCPDSSTARPNGFVLRRLKCKLGTRSMATGEIEFDGALGRGHRPALDQGFKQPGGHRPRHLAGAQRPGGLRHHAPRLPSRPTSYAAHRRAFGAADPRVPGGPGDPGPDAAAHHGRGWPPPSGSSP